MNIVKRIFIFIVVCTVQTSVFAKTHYVANVNELRVAVNELNSGDAIILSAGTYSLKERLIINKDNVTIAGKAYQTILDGSNVINTALDPLTSKPISWLGLIHIEGRKNVNISGIHLKNSNFAGIYITNSSSIVVQDSFTENTYSSGIGVWNSNYIYIYGNEISQACNGGGEESLTVATSKNVEVIGNNVHHNGKKDFAVGSGGEGIDIKDGSSNVTVSYNEVHNLYGRVGIYVDAWKNETYDIDIYNNNVFNNGDSGIVVSSECGGELHHIYIYDNETSGNAYAGIEVAGWSNDMGHCGKNPLPKTKYMNNIYVQANNIHNNGYGLCSLNNPIPCINGVNDEGQPNKGNGGINYGNPFGKDIYIEYNDLKSNKTDAYTSFNEYPQFNFWSHISSIDEKIIPNSSNRIIIRGNSFSQ